MEMLLCLLLPGLYWSISSCSLRWQHLATHGAGPWQGQQPGPGEHPEHCRARIQHSCCCRGQVGEAQQCCAAELLNSSPFLVSGNVQKPGNRLCCACQHEQALVTRPYCSISTCRDSGSKISPATQFARIKWTQGLISPPTRRASFFKKRRNSISEIC